MTSQLSRALEDAFRNFATFADPLICADRLQFRIRPFALHGTKRRTLVPSDPEYLRALPDVLYDKLVRCVAAAIRSIQTIFAELRSTSSALIPSAEYSTRVDQVLAAAVRDVESHAEAMALLAEHANAQT
uniref:Uncharacterized protein n=1 Tax=Neobodo designis TaxID=312471 RepID=A0A7S1LWW5_NEODS